MNFKNISKQSADRIIFMILTLFSFLGFYIIYSDIPFFIDDIRQRTYGELVLNYINSGSRGFFSYYNLKYYGPLWEVAVQFLASILPFEADIVKVRQTLGFSSAVLGVFYLYRISDLIFSRPASLVPPLVLMCMPQFFQNALINSKDIPFLSFFCVSMFYLNRFFITEKVRYLLCFCILAAVTTNIRIGGTFLLIIFSIQYLYLCLSNKSFLRKMPVFTLIASVSYFFTLYATYPWLWEDPLNRFIQVLEFNSQFNNGGATLFQGSIFQLREGVPRLYPWFHLGVSIPSIFLCFAVLGFILALVVNLLPDRSSTKPSVLQKLLLANFLWFALPLTLITIKGANLYNSLRQILFVLPSIALMLGFIIHFLKPRASWLRRGAIGVILSQCLICIISMMSLSPYYGAYFNVFAGDFSEVSKRETIPIFQTYMKEAIIQLDKIDDGYSVSGPFVDVYLSRYSNENPKYVPLNRRSEAQYYISYPEYDLMTSPPQGEIIKEISRGSGRLAYVMRVNK